MNKNIIESIYRAIDKVNILLPKDRHIGKNENCILLGDQSPLDSLGTINFIVALEEEIEKSLQQKCALLDSFENIKEKLDDVKYFTIGTLSDYIQEMMVSSNGK